MKEEEKLRVDRMAHDLEIKWTENLRYPGLFNAVLPVQRSGKCPYYRLLITDVLGCFRLIFLMIKCRENTGLFFVCLFD